MNDKKFREFIKELKEDLFWHRTACKLIDTLAGKYLNHSQLPQADVICNTQVSTLGKGTLSPADICENAGDNLR